MDYDFQLVHISGKKNGRMDALSRRPDYDQGEDDNKQLVVLPPKFFSQVLARVVGSEEANPNNKEEWCYTPMGHIMRRASSGYEVMSGLQFGDAQVLTKQGSKSM